MIPNTGRNLHKYAVFIGIVVSSLALALVTAFYVYSPNAYGDEAESSSRSEKERALLEEGAREIMGLNEKDAARALKDPEAEAYVPVKVETSSRYVKARTGSGASASRSSGIAASECAGERKTKENRVRG